MDIYVAIRYKNNTIYMIDYLFKKICYVIVDYAIRIKEKEYTNAWRDMSIFIIKNFRLVHTDIQIK